MPIQDGTEPVTDPELLEYAESCVSLCAKEFRRPRDRWPQMFELVRADVASPEYRMRPGQAPLIIIQRTEHYAQQRFQVGHEVFHWLCTPESAHPGVFHWTHELLAVEMCLACLRDAATPTNELSAYVLENEQILRVEAADLLLHEMLKTRLQVPYPQGLWGRAYVTGLRLKSKVGWLRVKMLADYFGSDGTPDVRAWLKGLSPPKRRQAAYRVLGTPDESWV